MPLLAWLALISLFIAWLFHRWEIHLTSTRSFRLKFPTSPMAFLNRKVIIESLVSDPQIQSALNKRAQETGQATAELDRQARRYASEIVPSFSAVYYFAIGYWMAKTLLLGFYQVRMTRDANEEYEKIGRDATVVLLMNHRSNMDVLLVNYLLSRRSTLSHAAGEWARLWPLYHLVKLAGNYVVDRDSNDPLYRLVLRRYVQMSISHGIHLGIFPEGGLSRDGGLQAMFFGLLNYVATASWPGLDRDVVFIPVSFNYDRIPEQESLVFEDQREFRDRGKLYVAFSSLRFCLRTLWMMLFSPRDKRYGWACASFGKPLSFKNWQRARGIKLTELNSEQRRQQVNELGTQLMDSALQMLPVMPSYLLALALREQPQARWTEAELFATAEELAATLEAAGAPLFYYDLDEPQAYQQGLQHLIAEQAIQRNDDGSVSCVDERAAMLDYYAHSIAHYLEPKEARPDSQTQTLAIDLLGREAREQQNLQLMSQSYDRAASREIDGLNFYASFYQRFIDGSPVVAEKFAGTDMAAQQAHLKMSLEHMLDYFVSGKPSERIRQIAATHSRSGRDIASELYDIWLEKLLETVEQYDEQCSFAVLRSWRAVLLPGISYMRSQYSGATFVAEVAAEAPGLVHKGEARQGSGNNAGIARWIEQWAVRTPDKIAISSEFGQLSYREFARQAATLASALRLQLDVQHGDRIAYLANSRPEFLLLTFACARLGAVLVPINSRLVAAEQSRLIDRADIKALFASSDFHAELASCESGFVSVLLDSEASTEDGTIGFEFLLQGMQPMSEQYGTAESALFIVFTSGSTGEPKGAVLTQGAVHCNALNSRLMHDMSRHDHVATTLPFFHVGGINIQTLPALQVGATVSVFSSFDAQEFLAFVERQRPTLTVLVPSQMQLLMDLPNWQGADMSSLRAVATGSAVVSTELIQAWANLGVPVIQIYGCTESCPIAIHQTVDGIGPGLGTVGHPALYTDLRIINEQGEALAPGKEGEIALRGGNLMSHYWRDEEATKAAFRDGWLLTGDLGYVDKNGRLCIAGRKKQLIISGGENIHPAEIERALESHGNILEAAVVARPHERWGEVPAALIVSADAQPLEESQVREHLSQRLGRFKHPRYIVQVDALPRTALAKVAYARVSEILARELGDQ